MNENKPYCYSKLPIKKIKFANYAVLNMNVIINTKEVWEGLTNGIKTYIKRY